MAKEKMIKETSIFHYPDSWAVLSNKDLRIVLLTFLQDLATQDLRPHLEKQIDVDDVFHFFFDDTDFHCNANGYIGEALFDIQEAGAVCQVAQTLDKVFEDLGDETDMVYLNSAGWTEVVEASRQAYSQLQFGEKKIILERH